MLYLLRALKPFFIKYRWYLAAGTAFVLVANLFSIYPAQVVRQSFDLVGHLIELQGLLSGYTAGELLQSMFVKILLFYGLIVLGFAVLRGVFLFLMRQTLIVMSRRIEYDQKNELYRKYQTYSLRLLRKQRTGDMMARMSEDVSNVRMFIGPGIMYSLNTLSLFLMLLVIMLSVNVELTLYVMIPVPLLTIALYYVHSIIVEKSDAAQRQLSVLTSFVQEAFSGIRLLKSYGREKAWSERYERESDQYQGRALSLARVDALFYPTVMLLIGLSILFIIWIGGNQVLRGSLTVGNIAEFIIYVNLLIWPVAALGWVTSLIQKAVASQRRIQEMLDLNNEMSFPEKGEKPSDYGLTFDRVSFTYPETNIEALRNVSFTLPEGAFVGVVGATGSGKSTLAHIVARFMDPDEGSVSIGGVNLKDMDRATLNSSASLVPQDVFLFSDTIRNNIAFGRDDATEAEIEKAARFAGLYEDIQSFPKGMDTELGERGVTLSGGQKQRLSIARAYLVQAPVLVLDDSLSAVDTRTEETILQELTQRNASGGRSQTLILITHRLNCLRKADSILVIEDGRLVEEGSFDALLAVGGLFSHMYERQELEAEILELG